MKDLIYQNNVYDLRKEQKISQDKAVSWCRDQQLEFDAVNDNLPEIVELYGTNSRKITCDFYIDDKAVLPAMVNG